VVRWWRLLSPKQLKSLMRQGRGMLGDKKVYQLTKGMKCKARLLEKKGGEGAKDWGDTLKTTEQLRKMGYPSSRKKGVSVKKS